MLYCTFTVKSRWAAGEIVAGMLESTITVGTSGVAVLLTRMQRCVILSRRDFYSRHFILRVDNKCGKETTIVNENLWNHIHVKNIHVKNIHVKNIHVKNIHVKNIRWVNLAFWAGVVFLGATLPNATQADDIRQVALISNDIAYSPATKQIYASVPGSAGVAGNGNSLTAIEPEAGTVGASVFVGSEPNQLAVSDDGQFVYIALDGQSSVGRFDTATGREGLKFSIGSPLSVEDMAVLPGSPHTLIVSKQDRRFSPHSAGTYVFDDGIYRPNYSNGNNTITAVSSTRIYGYDNEVSSFTFSAFDVDSMGLTGAGSSGNVISGYGLRLRSDNGLVFGSNGTEIDPQAQTVLGTFPGGGGGVPFLPDAKIGRVFFLTGSGSQLTLLAFDTQTFLEVGSLSVPGVSGSPSSLIRWGANGLAFRTSGGQLFLIRTSLITAAQPVSITLSPAQVAGGMTTTGMVTLAAPAPSGGVTLLLSSSNTTAATVPPSLTVAAGLTTATFAVTTQPVTDTTSVTVSAASNGTLVSAALTVQSPSQAHLLWDNTNGMAAVWSLADPDPAATASLYGPFSGWTAKAIAQGPNGNGRILWTNTNGQVALWSLADANPSATCALYGPYQGWTATALTVGPDNAAHLLWTNTDGYVALWNTTDPNPVATCLIYGPYTGWSGVAIGIGPDNQERLLWDNVSGEAAVWNLSDPTPVATCLLAGPYSGWTAKRLSVGPDNAVHLLWDNASGQVSLWNLSDPNPVATCTLAGPYAGWTALDLSVGTDGKGHLLWDNSGQQSSPHVLKSSILGSYSILGARGLLPRDQGTGQVALWNLSDPNPVATCTLAGPYSGWTAVSIAAGQ